MGFMKVMGRLPKQQPLEVARDLLAYVGQKFNLSSSNLEGYTA